jgi:2-C-methyl-D-erythritol 4-phosphate cytidylyltransferase
MPDVLGVVPLVDRGPIVFARFRGRALFLSAVDALSAAGAEPIMVLVGPGDLSRAEHELAAYPAVELVECPAEHTRVVDVASASQMAVIHDPLCPLVSAPSLRRILRSWEPATVTLCGLPLVDSVKAVREGFVEESLDRDSLRVLSSPVIMPPDLLREVPDLGATLSRPTALTEWLDGRSAVHVALAPPMSQRAEDISSLAVVELMDPGAPAVDRA